MAYQTPFPQVTKVRRSILSLEKESPISDDCIVMRVNHSIKHVPSLFSVQSCRAMVLYGAEHDKLWDFGMAAARKTMPAPIFSQYESKIQGYRDAYGTVLFLRTHNASNSLPQPLQDLMAKYPDLYEHCHGMH